MADNDRRRYVTEVLFFRSGHLEASSSSSWIFPCTGRRSRPESPSMAQLDAGAIETMLSGQASSDTGYSPVIQVINATEIKNNQTGAGSGRCAPTRPLSPPRRPAA